MTKAKEQATTTAMARAKARAGWERVYIPTLRTSAKDGAPVRSGLTGKNRQLQLQQQIFRRKGVEGCDGLERVGVLRLRRSQSARTTSLRMTDFGAGWRRTDNGNDKSNMRGFFAALRMTSGGGGRFTSGLGWGGFRRGASSRCLRARGCGSARRSGLGSRGRER